MRKHEYFEGLEVFLFLPLKFAIRTWFCNCPQYFCLFRIVVECSPSIHDQEMMLVLANRLLYWVLSTSDQDFVSFQPILCHPHTQIRIIFFHGVRIPIWKLSPNRIFNRIFSNCLSHNSPAKGCPVQIPFKRERLGLPYWTMILAICVVVDESKCLDIPILKFSIIFEASSILTWA